MKMSLTEEFLQMIPIEQLEIDFDNEMRGILDREGAINLNSTRFRQMIDRYGGIGAAHRLLEPDRELPMSTFSYLRKRERLDLAVEFYVVMEKYRPLSRILSARSRYSAWKKVIDEHESVCCTLIGADLRDRLPSKSAPQSYEAAVLRLQRYC